MSGFIVSSGLDLDSIFQLKPPAITDASGILIGLLLFEGIATDPSGLLVVPATGFKMKKTVPIDTIVDLADHYKKKGLNTYAVNTGFRISNNMDLSNVFEWGGYLPSLSPVSFITTGRTASIIVSGNYYAVDISCSQYHGGIIGGNSGQVSHNPYTFDCLTGNLVFGVEITFYVSIYNGFFGNKQLSTHKVTTYGLPKFDTVTLFSVTDTNLTFSFTGQNYSTIEYFMQTASESVYTIVSSTTTTISIPIVSSVQPFYIKFIPYNEFNELGQQAIRTITYKTQVVQHIDPITTLTQNAPAYMYRADFLVVGAGGSGGSGGSKPNDLLGRSTGSGGNGGGGGSGGYNDKKTVFDGTSTTRSVSYTCGMGGPGAEGVGLVKRVAQVIMVNREKMVLCHR
jgi:hypothetical protein